jgi:hypothetical protein
VKLYCFFLGFVVLASSGHSQVLLSKGTQYLQNFDTLANAAQAESEPTWQNNVTLVGWYAASKSSGAFKSYRVSEGENKTNGFYSFGQKGGADRALGSICSSNPAVIAYGVRFKNDTDHAITNVAVSYSGEQWRSSTTSSGEQKLAFSYKISSAPLTDVAPGSDDGWIAVQPLEFTRLQRGAPPAALDGNDSNNRKKFAAIALPNLRLEPGQELMVRWVDTDDEGQNDHGLAIDDLSVTFGPK